jgi:putative transposase
LPNSPGEVRIHPGAPHGTPALDHVRVLKVHRSGYYAWLREPLSPRAKINEALTLKIQEFYDQSMGIYGSPRIFCDLDQILS